MYRKYVKRIIDFILSLVGLIVLAPLFLIIVVAIKLDSRGPVLFTQKRLGRNKTYFTIFKFRTMYIDTPGEVPTHLLTNPQQYITRVGKLLRRTSLDELPQLWNILVGHMSIIGPRPALWNQHNLIAERDKYGANDLRPGLTGWAQTNGRDELPIAIKAGLDGEYVQRMSFWFDLKCFFCTLICVFKEDGVVEGCNSDLIEKEAAATIDEVKTQYRKVLGILILLKVNIWFWLQESQDIVAALLRGI